MPRSIPLSGKQLTPSAELGCTTGCTNLQSEGGTTDPELARVVEAWGTLPEPIRRAMLALVEAAAK